MLIKINPTGTHVHKGILKVRVDIFPAPSDKTYAQQYVDAVDDNGVPTGGKQLNPMLCHFISISATTTLAQLRNQVRDFLDKTTLTQIDDALSQDDRERVGNLMRNRTGTKVMLADSVNKQTLIAQVNARFAGLEVTI